MAYTAHMEAHTAVFYQLHQVPAIIALPAYDHRSGNHCAATAGAHEWRCSRQVFYCIWQGAVFLLYTAYLSHSRPGGAGGIKTERQQNSYHIYSPEPFIVQGVCDLYRCSAAAVFSMQVVYARKNE